MTWLNIIIAIMVIILIIHYFVLIPVARKKSNERKKKEMDDFFSSLQTGEKVVLLSGVVGIIESITNDYVNLKITDNTVIKVNKHGIASKIKNEYE